MNIASFLIDPYKGDKKRHAEVWQKIMVNRDCWFEMEGDRYEFQVTFTCDTTDDDKINMDPSVEIEWSRFVFHLPEDRIRSMLEFSDDLYQKWEAAREEEMQQ